MAHRAKQSIPQSGVGSVPVNDRKRLAEWIDQLGLDRVTTDLIAGRLNAWWYDHETGEFHPLPREHWENAEQVRHAANWGHGVGYRFLQDSPDGRSYQIFAAEAQASQPIKRAQSRKQSRKPKKKDRYKPKQADVQLDLLRCFSPDGKVPDRMSPEAVRQAIHKRTGRLHSWDTVNRVLRAQRGEKLPKK